MDIRDLAALVGMITGIAGFTLSIVNYRREEPRVNVRLDWNSFYRTNNFSDGTSYKAKVTIANAGRRDLYVTRVSIKIPEKYNTEYKSILLTEMVTGIHLKEGSEPKVLYGDQASYKSWLKSKLDNEPDMIKDIIVEVVDSAGRKYFSKPCLETIKFEPPRF